MIIEAICENGIVRMPTGLKYQHNSFKVKVELPDQEVSQLPKAAKVSQPGSTLSAQVEPGIRAGIDAILGPYKDQLKKGAPFTAQDYKEMRHEHLEEKYLGRR